MLTVEEKEPLLSVEPHSTWEMAMIADSILSMIKIVQCRTDTFKGGDDDDDGHSEISLSKSKASRANHSGSDITKTHIVYNMDLASSGIP